MKRGLSVGAVVSQGELSISVHSCSSSQQIIKTTGTQNYSANSTQLRQWLDSCNKFGDKAGNTATGNDNSLIISIVGQAQNNSGYVWYANEIVKVENPANDNEAEHGMSGGVIFLIILVCMIVVLGGSATLFFLMKKKRLEPAGWSMRWSLRDAAQETVQYEMLGGSQNSIV